MISLSPKVEEILTKYGWTPDRSVDIASVVSQLEPEGYILFDFAKEVLESFEGIVIKENDPKTLLFDFNGLDGLGTYDDVEPWMKANQIQLYPIGTYSQSLVLVGNDENIYVTEFSMIERVGNDFSDGLEAILSGCSGPHMVVIPPNLI